ncbi:MAG: glutamine synthetase GlnII [Patescibacteria group bacterium]
MAIRAEYIWLDGYTPTPNLRSKTKLLDGPVTELQDLPGWDFDGSSTEQAKGFSSDCLLKPVMVKRDPLRGEGDVLVMCEVMDPKGKPHSSNARAHLRDVARKYADEEAWFGIEQEYTLFDTSNWPLGFPEGGYPGPQGPYYCGVGAGKVFGRDLVEEHLDACLEAGIKVSGINAEVMPGQWEFQVGPLGPLEVSDEIWLARWLLHRLGEEHGIVVSLAPKPVTGDWNGAGAHSNFSTKRMRSEGGLKVIEEVCKKFGKKHKEHIKVYGADNALRLTGKHETCSIDEFRYGVSDRGASIRIPVFTANAKKGYLEDRRPAANMDPYKVTARMLETALS